MTDYGGDGWLDWADVMAVGVVAREYSVSPAAICLGGAIRREAQDGVDLAAAGIRQSASEIERLEERVMEIRWTMTAIATHPNHYDEPYDMAEAITDALEDDEEDRIRRRRD